MRIGIDCRLTGIEHAGLGRYIQNLVANLTREYQKVEWVLFLANQNQLKTFKPQKNIEVILTPVKHYTLQEQWLMNQAFLKAKLDLLHVPHFNVPLFYNQPLVVTIHDLLWHLQKGSRVTTLNPLLYWPKYFFYKLVVRHAVKTSQKIFVPSQAVANILKKYYPHAQQKTIVTYEGTTATKAQSLNFKLPAKYLLYVGSLYPHKNVEFVLGSLKPCDLKLLVISSRSVFSQKFLAQVKTQKLEDRVKFLGLVSEGELQTLYQKAYAVIQPSLSEGFGLTGIEAIRAKTALIASNIPVFHEIYQNAAFFFDPDDLPSLIAAITKLAKNRSILIDRGQKIIDRYSWQTMAKQTYQGYQQVLAK